MIDMNKKHTYQGKPVRIYADGSDTVNNCMHGAFKSEISGRWVSDTFNESDLVEVWEPTSGELVWCWDYEDTLPSLRRYDKHRIIWNNYAPFIGNLPEAFKGL